MNAHIDDSREFCERCHIGSVKPHRATYSQWHDGEFVIVPGLAAWRCDFCGDIFFDSEDLDRLFLLLGPESIIGEQQAWRKTGLDALRGLGIVGWRRA
jgi:YgiT-type zinc finger domain-containing protein